MAGRLPTLASERAWPPGTWISAQACGLQVIGVCVVLSHQVTGDSSHRKQMQSLSAPATPASNHGPPAARAALGHEGQLLTEVTN